jgi:hypothetical protein
VYERKGNQRKDRPGRKAGRLLKEGRERSRQT